jgi:purine-binding chemotaxis protein CheW
MGSGHTHSAPVGAAARAAGGQFLTFRLGAEEYAVDILRVQEIKGYTAVTPLPNAQPHVKGVMNLRGTVIPVIGTRERFGLPPLAYDKFTVIVIVSVGSKVVGLVVDAVSDVLHLRGEDVDAPPDFGERADGACVVGLAKAAERLVMVLDVGRVAGDFEAAPPGAPG